MKRPLFVFILSILFLLPLCAQKKEINAAADLVKAGKDLEKAELSMRNLLKDSSNRENRKIWNVLFDALRKQYDSGNEKLYLKQKYDTAKLFSIASRAFTLMESYDSIDVLPDRKGRIRPKMRKDNAQWLNIIRPNLYNGGIYYINKEKYSEAYSLLSKYIGAADQPMFKHYKYAESDTLLPEAAYWAVYCGYMLNDTRKVYHNAYWALKDSKHNESMLQFLAATYKLDGDTTRYINTLKEGFDEYRLSPFFSRHLIAYYSRHRDWKHALSVTDSILSVDSANITAQLAKSSVLINLGQYDDAFDICKPLLSNDSTYALAWLNAGLAKFNKGVALDKNLQTFRRKHNQMIAYYREALPYLERYRQLRPEAKDRWGLPLYTIYLNLNMGKEFDEISRIM